MDPGGVHLHLQFVFLTFGGTVDHICPGVETPTPWQIQLWYLSTFIYSRDKKVHHAEKNSLQKI